MQENRSGGYRVGGSACPCSPRAYEFHGRFEFHETEIESF